jgi:hypothetical protein
MNLDETFSVPRFLQFIDLAYLLEGSKVTDNHFKEKLSQAKDRNEVGNINATRQSILRSSFISAFSILEQNLDEIVNMQSDIPTIKIKPNDLKDRGIRRSITYANKVLGYNIDIKKSHWVNAFALQEVRNHLVHYGSDFSNSTEHNKKYEKFSNLSLINLRPTICFSIEQLDQICDHFMECVGDFNNIDEDTA